MNNTFAKIALLSIVGSTAYAEGTNQLHKPPYDFLFGNHLDTHQETR